VLKLDTAKAFDSVSWPFLLEVMQHLGFRPIWRDIICGLLLLYHTSVAEWYPWSEDFSSVRITAR
jgi:hypothetical protein